MSQERDDPHRPPPAKGGRRGRGTRPIDPDRPCLNCGDPTPGEYCPSCGQRKAEVQVSVRTLVMDVLEDQFILDKRLPRTMKALFFKPGHMTVEHVNGRIVRYIHPFRLYLVTSLIFFLLLSFFGLRLVRQVGQGDGPGVVATADSLDRELADLDAAIARIDRQTADTTRPAALLSTLEATRVQLVERRDVVTAIRDSLAAVTADSPAGVATGPTAGQEPEPDAGAADTAGGPGLGAARSGADPPTLAESMGWDDEPPTVKTGLPPLDSALAGQIRRLGELPPREAAETLLGTFFNYAPTMMFILLPVFAVVLKLLYIRRRRYYAEHFVFLLHVHSFVFVLATVMLVAGRWVGGWLEAILGLWILVYIYLAMRRVYGQGRLKTFAKYWILGWTYFWILSFTIPVAFAATLLLA